MTTIHDGLTIGVAAIMIATLAPASAGAQKLTTLHHFTGQKDGGNPHGALLVDGGTLYGSCGVIFKVDPATGSETVLHSFSGHEDGGNPEADLVYSDGAFYGTTFDGGKSGYGTVFKLVP